MKKEKFALRIKKSEIDYYVENSGYMYVVFDKPFEINRPPIGFIPTAGVPKI